MVGAMDRVHDIGECVGPDGMHVVLFSREDSKLMATQSRKYQLPCSCGKTLAIETSQAGQTVRCVCGKSLEVPTMRHIRQLAPIHDEGTKTARTSSWSPVYGMLFAAGLATMAIGLGIAGYYQLGRSQLDTREDPNWDNLSSALATVDRLTVDQTWESWLRLRDEEVGPYDPPRYIVHRQASVTWWRSVVQGLIIAGVGILLSIGSYVASRARSAGNSSSPAGLTH